MSAFFYILLIVLSDESPLAPSLSVSAFVTPIVRAFLLLGSSYFSPCFGNSNRCNILSTLRASNTHTSSTPLCLLAARLLSARPVPSPSQNADSPILSVPDTFIVQAASELLILQPAAAPTQLHCTVRTKRVDVANFSIMQCPWV